MKMSPKHLLIKDFDYNLPDDKIAKDPLLKRDESKLLIWKIHTVKEGRYFNLDEHLPTNAFMIFNNTKVVEARLLFQKTSGTVIEIFCLEPADNYPGITTGMSQTKKVLWKCFVGNAKKWKDEVLQKTIVSNEKEIILIAKNQ